MFLKPLTSKKKVWCIHKSNSVMREISQVMCFFVYKKLLILWNE